MLSLFVAYTWRDTAAALTLPCFFFLLFLFLTVVAVSLRNFDKTQPQGGRQSGRLDLGPRRIGREPRRRQVYHSTAQDVEQVRSICVAIVAAPHGGFGRRRL